VMELTAAQQSTPPLPGERPGVDTGSRVHDTSGAVDACRGTAGAKPAGGVESERCGYKMDSDLRCDQSKGHDGWHSVALANASTGCCTVCREPDEIKPEGER
jgi:hypothetical protein